MTLTTATPHITDERRANYVAWRSFYGGSSQVDKPRPGEQPIAFNYARTLVRKTASYVFPGPVGFQIVDDYGEPATNNNDERTLQNTYSSLSLHDLNVEMEIEASAIGDAAEKITWDAVRRRPRVVSVDPATLDATWSFDDPKTATSITQTYETAARDLIPYGMLPTNPDQQVRVVETWTDNFWSLSVPAHNWEQTKPNPYGWIPYLVLPNAASPRAFWGESDLVDLQRPLIALNRELNTLGLIMEMSGAPIAVLENVDESDRLVVRPGAKWEMPEDSKAYLLNLLEGGAINLHMDYFAQLREVAYDLSETPKTSFGGITADLSGAAREIDLQPLVQKVTRKRSRWARHFAERNRRILDLLDKYSGHTVGSDRSTVPIWPPILPSDDDALVRQQVSLVGAGIRSKLTANKALGSPAPEDELKQIADEATGIAAHEETNDE